MSLPTVDIILIQEQDEQPYYLCPVCGRRWAYVCDHDDMEAATQTADIRTTTQCDANERRRKEER
jgi:hypothetical protein